MQLVKCTCAAASHPGYQRKSCIKDSGQLNPGSETDFGTRSQLDIPPVDHHCNSCLHMYYPFQSKLHSVTLMPSPTSKYRFKELLKILEVNNARLRCVYGVIG
jgi:hypothetical protein